MKFSTVNGNGTPAPKKGRHPHPWLLAALGAGYVADAIWGDPARHHPVATFGAAATHVEKVLYADSWARGALHWAVCLTPVVAAGVAVRRAPWPLAAAGTAWLTWVALGGNTLRREATRIHRYLADGDVAAARERLPWLVGRDPRGLSPGEIARAVVESVAENTSDAVVGPALWGGLFGAPGVAGYRAVNTLDAMVGYRSTQYQRFGGAAARADDLANIVPSRCTAAAVVACAPLVGGSPREAWRAWRRDAGKHPSPNAGPIEAAVAGALGVRLGGANSYGGVVEDRGTLGSGRPVTVEDIPRAVTLCHAAGLLASVAAAALGTSIAHTARRTTPRQEP